MKTPVLLVVFNRPDLTEKTFKRISDAKPEKLFLVADGPREGNDKDRVACDEVKRIVENVTWDCEVFHNYSDENLGSGIRVASGISWVFEHVDRAIILEDDCLPDPTFFPFCEELLERYKNDERVMNISGSNLQTEFDRTDDSYYYLNYPVTWGWATWRRAWNYFDYHVSMWDSLRDTDFPLEITKYQNVTKYLRNQLESFYEQNPPDNYRHWKSSYAWDYQWVFACWVQNGLSITPSQTLISNEGFRKDATHTKNANHEFASLPTSPMEFPLKHPSHKLVNSEANDYHFKTMDQQLSNVKKKKPNLFLKVRNKVAQTLRGHH